MNIEFKTNRVDGTENVMDVTGLQVKEIRYCVQSRAITVVTSNTYTNEDLDGLSWQAVKSLVEEYGGEWTNKVDGIAYLVGRPKEGV